MSIKIIWKAFVDDVRSLKGWIGLKSRSETLLFSSDFIILRKPFLMRLYTQVKKTKQEWIRVLTRTRLFAAPRTVAHQAPLFMGVPRQEHGNGLPCPPPENLPNWHLLYLLHWQVDSLSLNHQGRPAGLNVYRQIDLPWQEFIWE